MLRPRLTLAALLLSFPAGAVVRPATPSNYCAVINGATPGDEVALAPGRYTAPCAITASGAAGRPLVVRSADAAPGQRAVFAYAGTSSNVIDLRGVRFVTLRDLSFARTANDVDAVKLHRSSDITVERCAFEDIGGVTISALDGDCARLTVRDCTLRNVRSTAIYLGCHDGNACHATEMLVERTLIDGTLPGDGVGYGIQIKLNSYGVLRDNTVYRTRGPGLMVYGSNRGDPASVLEGNVVEGAVSDACIIVGGGPARVVNNLVRRCGYAGIRAQNYGGRGLQRGVVITHNTAIDNPIAGVRVEGWAAGASNVLAFNAVLPRVGVAALDPGAPIASPFRGNVACPSAAACFLQGESAPFDWRPTAGGMLAGRAGAGPEPWRPRDDLLGVVRGSAADVGALEHASSPAPLFDGTSARPPRDASGEAPVDASAQDVPADVDMIRPDTPEASDVTFIDSATDRPAGASPPPAPAGCGCRTAVNAKAGRGWTVMLLAVVAGLSARRAGRQPRVACVRRARASAPV